MTGCQHKMKKPYKEIDPAATITNAQRILSKSGILVSERHQVTNGLHSYRLDIANDGLSKYHIGTNGKGISAEYARASAYGEFMERLQNNVLIGNTYYFSRYFSNGGALDSYLTENHLKTNFIYDPFETFRNSEEVFNADMEMWDKCFSPMKRSEYVGYVEDSFGHQKLLCAPFYDVSTGNTKQLPMDLLIQNTGSTGMCAGNTAEEALVQGLSEILERHAIGVIYRERLTPPTIDAEEFMGHDVYERIKAIENKGYDIIIKDFSLGLGLPVIGIIVMDRHRHVYNVKVGADPWPMTALERCLTELHQSSDGMRLIEKADFGSVDLMDDKLEYVNLARIFNNSSGQWPDSLFYEKPSYGFSGLDFSHAKSNGEDLSYLCDVVQKLGSRLFVRDVSYLGFNAYYIFSPGVSCDKKSREDHIAFNELFCQFGTLLGHLSDLSDSSVLRLAEIMERYYSVFADGYMNLGRTCFYSTEEEIGNLPPDLLLCMLFYRVGDLRKAYRYIKGFLEGKSHDEFLYYHACKDYISMSLSNVTCGRIRGYLRSIYGQGLARDVISDMENPKDVFKSYEFHSYFDSSDCDITKCDYIKIAPILKKLREIQLQSSVSQQSLRCIFDVRH